MALTSAEFEALMQDASKRIEGNIVWQEDEDHSPALEFRTEVLSDNGWPLFVRGSYNPLSQKLSYHLILKTTGRIYGLDLGTDHHNPRCLQVGERHKHRWTEQFRDKEAYVPDDITAPPSDPVAAWRQFCAESAIDHRGIMEPPPARKGDPF
jgi:hypothetical protein